MNIIKIIKKTTKDLKKRLPKSPGVYLFKNKKDEVVYVGRAANLKTRVSSYFGKSIENRVFNNRPVEKLIKEVFFVSFEKTSNLLEAAVLEANLIKIHMPKYNIKEKDNKSFVYLYFDMSSKFPKPIIVRGRNLGKYSGKGTILGPYQSQHILKNILLVARRLYPYSVCSPDRKKPCFHNQIGLCPGVCTGEISSKEYKKNIKKLIRFLRSRHPETKKKKINDIDLMPKSTYSSTYLSRIEGYDISHFQKGTTYGAMVVFENGKAKKESYRLFKIKRAKKGDDVGAIEEVVKRRLKHEEWRYPDLIVVDGGRQQVNATLTVLNTCPERSRSINIPVLGISKAGKHAQSSSSEDKLIFQASIKKPVREILASQKKFLQRVRNEAHRFSIKHVRNSQNKLK